MSRQASSLFEAIRPYGNEFAAGGCSFSGSQLAVSAPQEKGKGCSYCGLCLYGCPYGFIFNSATVLDELRLNSRFTYAPGLVVESLSENAGEVKIKAIGVLSKERHEMRAEKVFLGGGVFSTARILLESLEIYDQPIKCLDSQYFQIPLLGSQKAAGIRLEEIHTLNQLCLLMNDTSGRLFSFLQLYGYNDLYEQMFRNVSGPLYPLLRGHLNALAERLFFVQGYLRSEDSATIHVSLKRGKGNKTLINIVGQGHQATRGALEEVLRKLSGVCKRIGLKFLPFKMMVGKPGRGYHSGGSFPMRADPKPFESDLLGRPYSFKRVHLVDASVFPSIAPGPITLHIMANATRIADQSMDNG